MNLKRNLISLFLLTGILVVGCKNRSKVSQTTSNSVSSVESINDTPATSEKVSTISTINKVSTDYSGYYSNVKAGMNGQTLQETLKTIISKNYVTIPYGDLKDKAYGTTDCYPGTNIIWDMYSNERYPINHSGGNASEGAGWNKEHSVPQSYFNEASPMKSDLFHVYPTDCYVNNRRSNYPYGEVNVSTTYTSKNGSKLGHTNLYGYSGIVFEPIDEYKGDFARTYFYFATKYPGKATLTANGKVSFSNSFPYLTDYAIKLMTKWANQDPVSEKEINRNNAVYAIQKNRNPFIDHPEFIDIIFGNGGQTTGGGGSTTSQTSINSQTPITSVQTSTNATTTSLQTTAKVNCEFNANSLSDSKTQLISNNVTWNTDVSAMQYEARGIQYTFSNFSSNNGKLNITSGQQFEDINLVTVKCATNGEINKVTINVYVNNILVNASPKVLTSKDPTEYQFVLSSPKSGGVRVEITSTLDSKSFYLTAISIA